MHKQQKLLGPLGNVYLRLASHRQSPCFCLLSTAITGDCHHMWLHLAYTDQLFCVLLSHFEMWPMQATRIAFPIGLVPLAHILQFHTHTLPSRTALLEARPDGKPEHGKLEAPPTMLARSTHSHQCPSRLPSPTLSCSTVEEDNESYGFDALDLDGVYLPGLEEPSDLGGQAVWGERPRRRPARKSEHRLESETRVILGFIGKASLSTEGKRESCGLKNNNNSRTQNIVQTNS